MLCPSTDAASGRHSPSTVSALSFNGLWRKPVDISARHVHPIREGRRVGNSTRFDKDETRHFSSGAGRAHERLRQRGRFCVFSNANHKTLIEGAAKHVTANQEGDAAEHALFGGVPSRQHGADSLRQNQNSLLLRRGFGRHPRLPRARAREDVNARLHQHGTVFLVRRKARRQRLARVIERTVACFGQLLAE